MISDAMRASEVIKRIRAMLKKSVPEKTLLNMNETIHDVIGLTAAQLANSQIALRTNLAPDRLMVLGDRVQLQQVRRIHSPAGPGAGGSRAGAG